MAYRSFFAIIIGMMLAEGVILDGHYRLRQLLGRGGMGQVWEAEHTRLPKLFAIKFLLGLSHAEPELLMRFRREAEIASRLNHPSIVSVTDFNTLSDGTAYIVMERLEGEDLRARLGRGPLSLVEVREIVRQVASALELAHRQGIVHRDLKPENVFLCRESDGALRAKVLDFGISKVRDAGDHATRDDRVLGTPGYMAPEQAMGRNSAIDSRTDLFSLATIVYEMLTGQGVFVGETLAELCTKVLYHTPPPLEQIVPLVPRSLSVAVSRALSKEPEARQSDVRMFAAAIAGLGVHDDEVPTAATVAAPVSSPALSASPAPESLPTRAGRSSPRPPPVPQKSRRTWAIAGAVVGVCLVCALLFRVMVGSAPDQAPIASTSSPPSATTPIATTDVPARATPNTPPPEATPPLDAHGSADAAIDTKDAAPTPTAATSHSSGAQKRVRLSPAADGALADADAALARGDWANALRLARGTLQEAPSERAYTTMARAYCGQRDIGMAQAMLRNLPSSSKQAVRRECQTRGVRLP